MGMQACDAAREHTVMHSLAGPVNHPARLHDDLTGAPTESIARPAPPHQGRNVGQKSPPETALQSAFGVVRDEPDTRRANARLALPLDTALLPRLRHLFLAALDERGRQATHSGLLW
jgi:hypothetical protein